MSLRIRRGTEAQRSGITFDMGEIVWTTDGQQLWVGDGLTQGGSPVVGPNVAGFGLSYDPTTRRLEVAGLSADNITNGVNNKFFATELAQDAAASLFVTGTHQNITFIYDDALGKINATVALDGVGLTAIVADTTPELGGDLDLNLFDIIGTGNIDIVGDIDAFGNITASSVNANSVLTPVITSSTDAVSIGTAISPVVHTIHSNIVEITGDGVSSDLDDKINLNFNASRGQSSNPTTVQLNDVIGGISFKAYTGSEYEAKAFIGAAIEPSANGAESLPGTISIAVGGVLGFVEYEFTSRGALVTPILQVGEYATSELPLSGNEVKGMIVFDSTTNQFKGWNGTTWIVLG